MRKATLLTLLAAAIFASCTNNEYMEVKDLNEKNLPETRVFVQGQMIGEGTKGLAWPYTSPEGWETARFSIRADGYLPGYIDQSSALYYGRPANKDGKNRGKVLTAYPYGHYNDRDLDYTKVDKKTGNNIGLFRYVYDPQGLMTQYAILEAPKVEDILADEVDDLNAKIAANKDVAKNTAILADVNALIDLGSEYLNSHVLWYVVKEVGMARGWHVNGVIVDYEVPEPDGTPNDIEIDIHQQEHIDWNEIKTSVHVRTDAEFVKINIPLSKEDIIEQDDFDIRVYQTYFKDTEYSDVTVEITHDDNGITILIKDIDPALIESYKGTFGDGLTVEIHSYCKGIDQDAIWAKVKNSTVLEIGKPCTVDGQITNYFNDEKLPIKVLKPDGKK